MHHVKVPAGLTASAVITVVGVVLFLEGIGRSEVGAWHGLRFMLAGGFVFLCGQVWIALIFHGWRQRTLNEVYRAGYRRGREDANRSLLEAGLLLSLDEVADELYREGGPTTGSEG